MRKRLIFFVIALLVLTTLACSFNFSTANISEAKLAKDPEGNQPATTFAQDEAFYCVVQLANAPDETKMKAVWSVIEAENTDPNLVINETEINSSDGQIHFDLTNDKLWPAGKYKVDLYLNDKLDRTLEFQVEAAAAAAAPTVEPEPTDEPTATPEPTAEPTEEATVEPTEEATAEPTEEASAEPTGNAVGDVLQMPTAEATEEAQFEPLPFKEEPYVHPSKAFTLALPESFEGIAGDKTSVSFGDDRSVVAVEFLNTNKAFTSKEMDSFIEEVVKLVMDNYEATDHKVLEQKPTDNDDIFVAVAYESENGNGDADFIFTQRDEIVFLIYFITVDYEPMGPTWQKIIESYEVDEEAALVAAPAEAPAPKPTQPPAPAGPSAPAGKGLFIFINNTGVDFVVDMIGPTNDSKVVPPKSRQEFVLDPGHYTINGHSPGGDYRIDAYSFDIAAGQVYPLNLN